MNVICPYPPIVFCGIAFDFYSLTFSKKLCVLLFLSITPMMFGPVFGCGNERNSDFVPPMYSERHNKRQTKKAVPISKLGPFLCINHSSAEIINETQNPVLC